MTQAVHWAGPQGASPGLRRNAWVWAAAAALLAYVAALGAAAWLLLRTTPDVLSFSLGGHAVTLHHVHAKVIGNAGALMATLPLALIVEAAVVGWPASSARRLLFARSPSMKTDVAVLLLGQARVLDVVGRVLMLGASLVSGAWIHARLAAHGLAPDFASVPWLAQLAIFFVLHTFFDYWTHRIDHTHVFWPLHRYHHAAEDFAVVTASRQHPVNFVGVFVFNLPLAALGASPDVLLWVNLLLSVLGYLTHSEIASDWGWFGRWVLQSPLHHRLHHKLSMDTPTGHFGIMPIWDHLFGTWYGGERPGLPIGVAAPYRHGWWIAPDLLRDYKDFWLGVIGRRAPE